jgi:hypothetical protein
VSQCDLITMSCATYGMTVYDPNMVTNAVFVKNNAAPRQKRKISCNEEEQWEGMSNKAIAATFKADLISNPISGPVEYLLM